MVEANGVILTCFISDSIIENYLIDQRQFFVCVNTLLANAAHNTQSGRVHIHVTLDAKEHQQTHTLTVIIADTGAGLSQDRQLDLMRDESSDHLAHVMKASREIGAQISFKSSLGRGSEFIFTYPCAPVQIIQDAPALNDSLNGLIDIEIDYENIPIPKDMSRRTHDTVDPAVVETSPASSFDPSNLRGLRVLIVDDVPSNQDVVKLFLEPEGCECFCVSGGEDALEILKTQSVDLILMDIRMPGISGIDTILAIRNGTSSLKDIPIIALTADRSAQTNAACMMAGADLFLTKPVLCRDLLESIWFVRRYQDYDGPSNNELPNPAINL